MGASARISREHSEVVNLQCDIFFIIVLEIGNWLEDRGANREFDLAARKMDELPIVRCDDNFELDDLIVNLYL